MGARIDPQIKKDALKLFVDGVSLNDISERLGVQYKTVWRWVSDYKQDNGISECALTTEDIPPVTCDIKKEPATAATVTSSKDNNSNNILTAHGKNVKYVYADEVIKAVQKCISDKVNELEELSAEMIKMYDEIEVINNKIDILNDTAIYRQSELERLQQDYNRICEGV